MINIAPPAISILMTSFNREQYISEAIQSVLDQSLKDYELIILDDASTDNTVKIASTYASFDKRIRLYVNDKNLGDYPNRNKAASFALGDILMFVDSDDTIVPDALQYIFNMFMQFKGIQHSAIYYESDISLPTILESDLAIRNHYFNNNSLSGGPGSRVFRREFYKRLGGYPVKYGPANDMFFNIVTTSASPILMLPYNYLNYRRHEGQQLHNEFAYLYNNYNYLTDILNFPDIPLSLHEKEILNKGNKKRFLINAFNYFIKKRDISQIKYAFKVTGFGFRDLQYLIRSQ